MEDKGNIIDGSIEPFPSPIDWKNKENPNTQKMKTNVLMVKNKEKNPFKTILQNEPL
jgi:hypothetical protein